MAALTNSTLSIAAYDAFRFVCLFTFKLSYSITKNSTKNVNSGLHYLFYCRAERKMLGWNTPEE
jgi:hypothetical protein